MTENAAANVLGERIGRDGERFEDRSEARESIALLLLSVAASDSALVLEEQKMMQALMLDAPEFGGDEGEARRCFYHALGVFNEASGLEAALSSAWELLGDTASRERVATMILAVILADGRSEEAEVACGSFLLQKLEVSATRAAELKAVAASLVIDWLT